MLQPGIISIKAERNGKMKKKLCLLLSAAILASASLMPYYASAADEAFISGYEDGTFRPDGKLTRAEAASMISQLISGNSAKDIAFSDVDGESWYYSALTELNAKDMLNSYGTKFEGNKNITRLEFAELIYIYKNGYKAQATREDMFTSLTSSGIISGYEDGTYRQNGELTRAEAVALVNRITEKAVDKEGAKQVFDDVTDAHWAFADTYAATASESSEIAGKNMFTDPAWGDNIQYQPGVTYPIAPPADQATKEMDKYNEKGSEWVTVGMINDDLRSKGVTIGSDGAQRPNALAISNDGQLLFVGHDISSIHRSTDGGQTWHKAGKGFWPMGAHNIIIDPNNDNRVIAIGGSGLRPDTTNGIYISEDKGDTFDQVLVQIYGGGQLELKTSACWDASSYDEEIGGSAVAYWSKNYRLNPPDKWQEPVRDLETYPDEKEGLWKTTDGGYTWEVVNPEFYDSVVAVHPETGVVYAGNDRGFFRSEDGGVTFENILDGCMIYGLDVIDTEPDSVYLNDYMGVLVSRDSGKTFTRIESSTFPASVSTTNPYQSVRNIKVSPANPMNMVVAYNSGWGFYDNRIYFSNDGGVTWARSAEDYTGYFFSNNDRDPNLVWDPTNGNEVWGFVGDYASCSEDGGATFKFAGDGMCDFFVDQRSMFSLYDPDVMYFGSQDFFGALTRDNGENWEMIWKMYGNSVSGFIYGSYATHDGHLVAARRNSSFTLDLTVSHDWGQNWTDTGIVTHSQGCKWLENVYQSPTDENVLLVGGQPNGYRSTDKGYTWEPMDIEVVQCHNPYGRKELYGSKGNEIYVSYDSGATWEYFWTAKTLTQELIDMGVTSHVIWDMTYDGVNDILYYCGGYAGSAQYFCKVQNGVETDLTDTIKAVSYAAGTETTFDPGTFQLCAVDPRYPQVIYVGGYRNSYKSPAGVLRSVDGGESFQILSNTDPKNTIVKTGQMGGIEPFDLIVHPVTGELWVPQSCAGWAKIAPPYENN